MNDYFNKILKKEIYFMDDSYCLLLGDSIKILSKIESETIDLIFADPPYFLSNGGITCQSGKMVLVDKGDWDKKDNIKDIHKFNTAWLKQCKRILKKDGTIWISGTFHNIYSIGLALQELDYKVLNNITWFKNNAPPNLSCRFFTHSTEQIIWASKSKNSKHYFNYELMKQTNGGKQMRDVWNFNCVKQSEKKHGKFPTQKPLELLERIILSSSIQGMTILDPFNGSGTTGIVSNKLGRNYIGIDISKDYLDLSIKRYLDKD
jgi:site-specific DNA-methyltransferase (adenine-specific)